MAAVETTSMMSDVGLNIYQLRILLRILRNKLGATFFEPEHMMKNLSGDIILPKFGEYKYNNMEKGSKPEHILFWVRDAVAVFKKETQLLIESGEIDISNINRIDIVVGGDHSQGVFRFPMKILYIMNNGTRRKSIQPVGYILCKKDNGIILKNTIIKDLGDSINSLNESMSFNNQHLSSFNIYVTGDLAFSVMILGKEHSSPHWCIKCKSPSKYWKLSNHSMGDEWTVETLKIMSQIGKNADNLGVKEESYWDFVEVDNFICPIPHNQINLGNNSINNLLGYGNECIEKISVDKYKARNSLLLIDSSINEIKIREEFNVSDEGKELNSLKILAGMIRLQ